MIYFTVISSRDKTYSRLTEACHVRQGILVCAADLYHEWLSVHLSNVVNGACDACWSLPDVKVLRTRGAYWLLANWSRHLVCTFTAQIKSLHLHRVYAATNSTGKSKRFQRGSNLSTERKGAPHLRPCPYRNAVQVLPSSSRTPCFAHLSKLSRVAHICSAAEPPLSDMTVPAFVTATPLSTVQGSNFSAARSRSPATSGTIFSTPKNWRMSVSAPASYKDALIERVTPLDFGRTVADNRADQDEIEELIRLVESTNKSNSPATDPNLTGVWDMIYTTSTSILGTGRPSFLLPSRIVQEINAAELSGRNSETYKFGPIEIENAVEAKLTPVSENRFDVNFVRFIVGGLIKINVESNERFTGWLSVTYLDENLRISRGNKGNVFVLVKK